MNLAAEASQGCLLKHMPCHDSLVPSRPLNCLHCAVTFTSLPFVGHQDGKTDYKSITVAEDSTAEEFMDFYLDDDARARWVRLHWECLLVSSALQQSARYGIVAWLHSL